MEVFGLAFSLGCFLQLQSALAQTLHGSCIDAGYTTCCEGPPSNCSGQPPSCFCDSSCHEFSDCCQDIDQLCPTLPQPPKPLLLPPTHITFHSATIQWITTLTNSSTNGTYTYLVNYSTGDNVANLTAANVTEYLENGKVYSFLLGGLDPGTKYTYSVTAMNTPQRSTSSEEAVLTTMEHPVVRHIRTAVLNTTSVRVSWSALALPPGVRVTHYFVRYSSSTVPPQEGTREFPASVSCGEVGGLVPHTTYLFHVEGMILDIDGSVSQEGSPDTGSVIFVPDAAAFQLRGGPLASCDGWNAERERGLSTFFQFVAARAISHCCYGYQDSLISGGALLCEGGTPVYATYRANLMSTENCTTADLLRCVEDWVAQGPAVEEPTGTLITLDSSCPASIPLRSDPLCKQVVAGVTEQCNTTVPSTETCIGVPILVAAMVAELLLVAAIAMLVTVAALLVHSNKGKRSISSGHTLQPSTQQEIVPNVYESGPPVSPTGRPHESGPPVSPTGQPHESGPPVSPTRQPHESGPPVSPTGQLHESGSPVSPTGQPHKSGQTSANGRDNPLP